MAVRIYTTRAGVELDAAEVDLVGGLVDERGRAVLIAPSFAEIDVCRHDLARAGVALGVDYATPARWTGALWGLLGDGRCMVDDLARRLLFSDILSRRVPEELEPLGNTPGTARMLGRMARDLLPGVAGTSVGRAAGEPGGFTGESAAEKRVAELLRAYADELDRRGLVEPCEAAEVLAGEMGGMLPACARTVIVRGVTSWTYAFLQLLGGIAAAGSDIHILLAREQAACVGELTAAFSKLGCEASYAALGNGDIEPAVAAGVAGAEDGVSAPVPLPRFLEVSGPHARARAYADAIVALADEAAGHTGSDSGVEPGASAVPHILAVAPDAAALFAELAPRLAAHGIAATTTDCIPFARTAVGGRFTALADLVDRMKAAEEGRAAKTEWWPAPELTDWIYSPVSGGDAARARQFDKNMRISRAKTVEGVMSLLQSIQGQVRSDRKKLDADHPLKHVPCVVYDVFQAIWRAQPVKAFKAMLEVAEALPDRAFGGVDGQLRREAEIAHARRAIKILTEDARDLDVSQASAVPVLDGVRVAVRGHSRACDTPTSVVAPAPRAQVEFVSLRDAAAMRPDSYDAVFFADVDLDGYPLSHEEGPLATLAAALGRTGVELEPAALLRVRFARAMQASRARAVLARVTHDRQARDRYPAAIWTELHARAKAVGDANIATVGEGDIVADFDPAAGEGLVREGVTCEAPQHLSAAAVPYLVLRRRASEEPGAPLVPRLTSASQIEAYSSCPLCWFVSYRVKPQTIDAGFGGMEKGNFVHDVLEHLHRLLPQEGMERVTPENLPRAQELLHRVFDETLVEHAGKRGAEGPLVPISPVEERQVAEILPQLEGVLAYEAEALAPFAPRYLEFSFNDLGVEYAGWPLGGRIDRVDVDAENRAVVIDYKHRAGVEEFKLADPTVRDEKTGEAAADDPRWLPPHTQTLIYAQAMRRALGLDTRAALYFSTKGGKPAMRGAASAELLEEERGDGRIPGLKKGFPGEGGSMDFDGLLDRVEAGIAERLDELERGVVAAADPPCGRCPYNHGDAFMRRDV